jgi:hypothetical protein
MVAALLKEALVQGVGNQVVVVVTQLANSAVKVASRWEGGRLPPRAI